MPIKPQYNPADIHIFVLDINTSVLWYLLVLYVSILK